MNDTLTLPAPINPSKAVTWTGRILAGLATAFLALDAVMKVIAIQPVIDATTKLGFSVDAVRPMGTALLLATILFAIPRTAVLGGLFVTAYLGGAVATMVHAGQPFWFPIVFAIVIWASLVMRRPQLRAILFPASNS